MRSTPIPPSRSSLWEELLAGAVAYEVWGAVDSTALHPQERAAIANAATVRQDRFAAGRACAHYALTALGLKPGPLLRGKDGRPLWPQGLVGSITHTDTYAAAVVMPQSAARGVGIDAERLARLTPGMERLICTPLERKALDTLEGEARAARIITTFSAKEAFYKAQSGFECALHDFQQVEVTFSDDTFEVRTLAPTLWRRTAPLMGRYRVVEGMVFSAFALVDGG